MSDVAIDLAAEGVAAGWLLAEDCTNGESPADLVAALHAAAAARVQDSESPWAISPTTPDAISAPAPSKAVKRQSDTKSCRTARSTKVMRFSSSCATARCAFSSVSMRTAVRPPTAGR